MYMVKTMRLVTILMVAVLANNSPRMHITNMACSLLFQLLAIQQNINIALIILTAGSLIIIFMCIWLYHFCDFSPFQ